MDFHRIFITPKRIKRIILGVFLLSLLVLMLLFPEMSYKHACNGLLLWFHKILPTLFPFMVLSRMCIELGYTEYIIFPFRKVLQGLYGINGNGCYCLFMGFLCGFPMGAKTSIDLYEKNLISFKEAEFLLAFTNNLGPVYILTFILPSFEIGGKAVVLGGFYGVPLLYGLFLRYFKYRRGFFQHELMPSQKETIYTTFSQAVQRSLECSIYVIVLLGGYMIFFQLLYLFPSFLSLPILNTSLLQSLLEISGGMSALAAVAADTVLYSGTFLESLMIAYFYPCLFALLTFGGASCFFQTKSILKNNPFSMKTYLFHKVVQSILVFFYFCVFG